MHRILRRVPRTKRPSLDDFIFATHEIAPDSETAKLLEHLVAVIREMKQEIRKLKNMPLTEYSKQMRIPVIIKK